MEPPAPGPGQVVLGCTLEGVLGRGGMGIVYRARDPAGRPVAVKLILGLDGTRRERFEREAQALASLRHPGIVLVHAAELTGMQPALIMELVEGGRGLDTVFTDPTATVDQKLDLLEQVCRAVEHAHGLGIVHRDLKPQNVLVTQDGRAKVADFGLALDLNRETRLTKTGAIVGTPNYLAPEQVNGSKGVSRQVDVWALGIMLFEAVTRTRPFEADSAIGLLGQILSLEPPAPSTLAKDPGVGVDHDAVVARALAKTPAQRYATVGELGDEIARLRAGTRPHAPPPPSPPRPVARALAGAAIVVVLLALGGWLALRRAGPPPPSAPRAPITLSLAAGVAALSTTDERVVLAGTLAAAPETAWLELTAGELRQRVGPGPFRVEVPLRSGVNQLVVAASDELGADAEPLTVRITLDLPPWFLRLPVDRRPPLPLPAGIRWLEQDGRYRAADGSELVWVPPAEYTAIPGEGEQPRQVRVEAGFFVGRTEVSWRQWKAWVKSLDLAADAEVTGPRTSSDECPVSGVPWPLAVRYCSAFGLRLPSEAEWELAERGTDGRLWPWGADPPPDAKHCRGEGAHVAEMMVAGGSGEGLTAPVDSYPEGASPYGCLHMVGNASEWTTEPSNFPGNRIARGGSWLVMASDPPRLRFHVPEVSPTESTPPGNRSTEQNRVGFRVAR